MNTLIPPRGFIRFALCLLLACAIPATAVVAAEVYIVKKHDTLSGIARKFGVSTSELARRNELSNINLLKTGTRLFIPDDKPEPFAYKVQKGDSVATIAKRFGAPQAEIVKLNKLTDANRINIGQMLLIPGSTAPSTFSPTLLAQINGPAIKTGRWKYIVIHHSATDDDSPTNMDRHHRTNRGMENGLAYHFVIGGRGKRMGNGELFVGHRWTGQIDGGHVRSSDLNHESIGICLVGNFETHKPTDKQMEVLEDLVRHLMKQCGLGASSVKTHTQVNPVPTTCPGKHFPTKSFIAKLKN